VLRNELADLWIGGKALHLILIYTVVLGLYSYLLATNTELNLLPLKEMVLEMVKAVLAVSMFMSLIIGADSISGERERLTLEGLLLTPASRRQIVFGKFLAAVSPWPVAFAIAVPYWHTVAQGDAVLGRALLWGALLGSLLAPACAALGLLVSLWCNTNRTSMLVSIALYLLLLLPTDLVGGPAKIQRSAELWAKVDLIQWSNPVGAVTRFLQDVLVRSLDPADRWSWHTVPVLFAVLVLVALFAYASPRLRLEADTGTRLRSGWDRVAGLWERAFGVPSKSPS
jgi:ABC-2 type transport system permease protein